MAVTGRIHSFQSMGAVDGPGLRYVVFFQGCPLRCTFCHNPDTWEMTGGAEYTVEQVLERVLRCRGYLKKGGVTATGGEPLAQGEFVEELFRQLRREGIHTALDTSGAVPLDRAERVLEQTDLVLADLKFTTEEEYRRYTGDSLSHTLEFLELCRKKGIPLWIRHVVIPGLTDTEENIQKLGKLLEPYPNVERVELLPFRTLCLEKYRTLGIPFPLEGTPEMDLNRTRELEKLLSSARK